jgi:hypothetical protein
MLFVRRHCLAATMQLCRILLCQISAGTCTRFVSACCAAVLWSMNLGWYPLGSSLHYILNVCGAGNPGLRCYPCLFEFRAQFLWPQLLGYCSYCFKLILATLLSCSSARTAAPCGGRTLCCVWTALLSLVLPNTASKTPLHEKIELEANFTFF